MPPICRFLVRFLENTENTSRLGIHSSSAAVSCMVSVVPERLLKFNRARDRVGWEGMKYSTVE